MPKGAGILEDIFFFKMMQEKVKLSKCVAGAILVQSITLSFIVKVQNAISTGKGSAPSPCLEPSFVGGTDTLFRHQINVVVVCI